MKIGDLAATGNGSHGREGQFNEKKKPRNLRIGKHPQRKGKSPAEGGCERSKKKEVG